MQNKLKLAVIGVGNMGTAHAKHLYENKIENAMLCALCDIDERIFPRLNADFKDIPIFKDYNDLLKNSDCDAVIVATPHYSHPEIAISALKHNKHILTEKPIGVLPSDINKLIETAKSSDKKFGIMFNQRTNSLYKKAKELVENGAIGKRKRLIWIITNWYRTQSYYNSSGWRASWAGEGGGVLVNQAPHQLDLISWIFGKPNEVLAKLSVAKYHDIEVEDDAELLFSYDSGENAVFITSTGECPGTNRLEITGDKGKIVIEEGKLKLWKSDLSERDFCFSSEENYFVPEYEYSEFVSENEVNGHIAILNNFCNHILFNEPLIASGFDGINQAQMSSGAYLSYFTGQKVRLGENNDIFETELKKRYSKAPTDKKDLSQNENHAKRWEVKW